MPRCLPTRVYCALCAHCLLRPEEGIVSLRTAVTDGCGPPCRCWGIKPGSSGRVASALNPRDMAPDPTSGMIYGFWGMKSGLMDLGWPQTQYVSEGGFECHIFHVL